MPIMFVFMVLSRGMPHEACAKNFAPCIPGIYLKFWPLCAKFPLLLGRIFIDP